MFYGQLSHLKTDFSDLNYTLYTCIVRVHVLKSKQTHHSKALHNYQWMQSYVIINLWLHKNKTYNPDLKYEAGILGN